MSDYYLIKKSKKTSENSVSTFIKNTLLAAAGWFIAIIISIYAWT